ncbi:TMV resistance protein N [Prunus persica]|nr:TMV resistance protein N [Prunus persica]XP_020426219.1 TMV resistance protein N [Prunus persica]XP_020426220.1 TMV resistance protein N [Prunus persica]
MALSTKRDSAFLPSPDQYAPQPNHDVFLSFRGEDTRLSFVSHLYHELLLRGIKTFKDDPKLERGTPISSELFNAIEESRLAIVVLSPNYASSSWCLDELTKILQCMKSKSTVLPVFYHVDPSDIRKQTGSFACAFAEHEERFREDRERVKSWRAALTEVANLSGFDSKNECERKLIENIVEWVWEKVHHRFKLLGSTELVGMKFIREQVDLLLAHPTDDVRFVGIWGMGGIGKTTIAKLVYDRISIHYEVNSFLANVREVSQRGDLVNLQRQLLSPILKDQFTQVWDEQWGTSVIKNCLYNKKVLLILDDVSESSQLEKLAGEKDWFGKGSIIIITTRDKRLLVKHDIHISCKVEALGNDDALVLFSLNAFKKNEPEEGFLELSKGFVSYAKGLPLALKLLGCLVYKRDQDEWRSELDKLQKIPKSEIIDLLKISYDRLDEMNKDIFLDVAFFHKGKDKEEVIEILDSCGLCGCVGINDLVQKSLLTISHRNVEMHDLIQEMALEIVRRECSEEPGRRSRLCNCDDISHVFINNTATNKIKGIALGMARLEMGDWNCEAFSKMCNLKILEFDNVIISSSPRILPNSLRSIKWSLYPSKFLPSGFQPNFLIALEMCNSKLVRLWDGRKDLPNLKKMKLVGSENLTTTPDFSGVPNLELLDFQFCKNLVEIHPSIVDLKCLESLNLGFCSKLKKIPEFSGQMKNLSFLLLSGTSIEKLSSSIGCLVDLTILLLEDCKNLTGLPSEICNLKSLTELEVSGCSKIDKLPENMGEMESLTELQLYETSIRQLPRSIVGLKKLMSLSLGGRSGSQPNKSRFWWGLPLLNGRKAFVLASLDGLFSLKYLDLSNCGVCEGDLPSDIGCLSSLKELRLSGNNFVSLPASVGCLSKLTLFWVNGCQSLEQLPDLSKLISLVDINIANCTSLKMLPHLSSNFSLVDIHYEIHFCRFKCANCFVLVDNEGCDSIILKMLQRYLQLQLQLQTRVFPRIYLDRFEILTPGRKIPEWFSNQSLGDSLTVELPTTWMGIALCVVFEVPADLSEFLCFRITSFSQEKSTHRFSRSFKIGDVVSDHLWVIFLSHKQFEKIYGQIKVLFTTDYSQDIMWGDKKSCVKRCGFCLVHEQDVEQLNQIMMNKSIIKSTTIYPTNSADAQGQHCHDD